MRRRRAGTTRRCAAIVTMTLLVAMAGCDADGDDEAPSPAATSPSTVEGGGAPSGGRVDVGGYELAYVCQGDGEPTVVLEAGYDSAGTSTFADLLAPIAEETRVCTYDRAGTGTSDPRPSAEGLTSADQASELRSLLEAAAIEPPYVLVGHSYGGFVARLFAAAYQDETAGLILIESSHEDEIEPYRDHYGNDPAGDWVDGGDLLDIDATADALRTTARNFGELPLVVIRAETYEDVLSTSLWRRTQADLATLSSNALYVVADGSGHFVQDEAPEVVLAAIHEVLAASRAGSALPACEDVVASIPASCPA